MSAARPFTVAVLGGAGVFGTKACSMLASSPADGGGVAPMRVVMVGRRPEAAVQAALAEVRSAGPCAVEYASLDARDAASLEAFVRENGVDAVIDAAGPFQGLQDGGPPGRGAAREAFSAPRACVRGGARLYADLADAAEYVAELPRALDEEARDRGACVVTGASTVPGLSGSVLASLSAGMAEVRAVSTCVLPGNDAPRGTAVMQSVVGAAGKPLPRFRAGGWVEVPAWGETALTAVRGVPPRLGGDAAARAGLGGASHVLPAAPGAGMSHEARELGACLWRLRSVCDAPDALLWPAELAGRRAARGVPAGAERAVGAALPRIRGDAGLVSSDFSAGLELWWMHAGLCALSQPVRWGLAPSGLGPLVPALKAVADAVRSWGSDRGGMVVRIEGWEEVAGAGGSAGRAAVPCAWEWHLVAGRGHGPHVPVTVAVALVEAERRRAAREGAGGKARGAAERGGGEADGGAGWEWHALRPGARHAGGLVPLPELCRAWERRGLAIGAEAYRLPTGSARDSAGVRAASDGLVFVPLAVEGAEGGAGGAGRSLREGWNDGVLGVGGAAARGPRPRPRGDPPAWAAVAEHSAPPVWRTALGESAWCDVGPVVRAVHGWPGDARVASKVMSGRAVAYGGAGLAGGALRGLLGLPRGTGGAAVPLEVRMTREPVTGGETWQRLFGRGEDGEAGSDGHAATRLSVGASAGDAGTVWEQAIANVGGVFAPLPARVGMRAGTAPNPDAAAWAEHGWRGEPPRCLVMEANTQTVLGLPLPGALRPRVVGREWEGPIPEGAGGRFEELRRRGTRVFRFDVSIAVPVLGEAAGYSGFLLAPENARPGDEDPWGCMARRRAAEARKEDADVATEGIVAATPERS